jgi:hypothetical protein
MSVGVADGTAVANTTTETIIFPGHTVPAFSMNDIGRALRVTTFGRHSTTGTPTLIFRIRWGGVSGAVLWVSETITTGSAVTAANWQLEALIVTRAIGTSGSLFASGWLALHTSATASSFWIVGSSGYDAPAAVTGDLTIDQSLVVTAQWGTASASNTLTGHQLLVESLN